LNFLSLKVRLSQLERRLDDLEKIPCYNDLDNVISQKEITVLQGIGNGTTTWMVLQQNYNPYFFCF
jgi:hypothetical protein